MENSKAAGSKDKKKFVFFISKEKHETDQPNLTVRTILTQYGKIDDLTNNTLSLKEEGNHKEYTDLDEVIIMKDGMHFTIFNNAPTPIS